MSAPRPESWEAVAHALAERLRHQANACPAGYYSPGEGQGRGSFNGEEGVHHDPDEAAEYCAFCADTIAYRRFVARRDGRRYTRPIPPEVGD